MKKQKIVLLLFALLSLSFFTLQSFTAKPKNLETVIVEGKHFNPNTALRTNTKTYKLVMGGSTITKRCADIGKECNHSAEMAFTQYEWDIYWHGYTQAQLLEANVTANSAYVEYLHSIGFGM